MESVGAAPALVGGRIDDARVGRVQRDVHDTGVLVDMQRASPVPASICRDVETALLVGSPEVSHSRDEHHVRVGGVHCDPSDMVTVHQSHIRPRLAPIRGLVDSVAPGRTLPARPFPSADPDDVGIELVHGYRTYRVGALILEDRLERHAVVRGLPHTASGRRDIKSERIGLDDSDIHDAPAHVYGTDLPERQVGERAGVQLLRRQARKTSGQCCAEEERQGHTIAIHVRAP